MKKTPRALLLAGIRAYADVAERAAGDHDKGAVPAGPARGIGPGDRKARQHQPSIGGDRIDSGTCHVAEAGTSDDASFASFVAAFVEESQGSRSDFVLPIA